MAKRNVENQLVSELASIIIEKIIPSGDTDISAEEVARTYYQGLVVGESTIADVRKKLSKIRDTLLMRGVHTVLINEKRLDNAGSIPASITEAYQYLGYFNGGAAGLHVQQAGSDDLIWQAWQEFSMSSGAGKIRRGTGQVTDAVDEGRITPESGSGIVQKTYRRAGIDQPEVRRALNAS